MPTPEQQALITKGRKLIAHWDRLLLIAPFEHAYVTWRAAWVSTWLSAAVDAKFEETGLDLEADILRDIAFLLGELQVSQSFELK